MSEPAPAAAEGQRYELREQLQTSTSGALWRAFDHVMDRPVHIRQLRAPQQLAPEQRRVVVAQRARAAVRARGALFTGLVPVFDVLAREDEVLVVTDAIEGRRLGDLLRSDGPLPAERVASITSRLARTLAALHAEGLAHGDLRPSRVLLDEDQVWLVAYGLERPEDNDAAATLLASPAYLSPQRARGAAPSTADDVWALGVMSFAMAEGAPPFSGHSVEEVLDVVTKQPAPPCRSCPPAVAEVVAAMLTKDPAERPTAASVRRRLESPPAPRTEPAPERLAQPTPAKATGPAAGADVAADERSSSWSHNPVVPLIGIAALILIVTVVLSKL